MSLLSELTHNATLLLALAILYSLVIGRLRRDARQVQFLTGVLFGVVAVIGMVVPAQVVPGVVFDGRSVVLSLGGLFGGPLAAGVAALIAGAYRVWLGGAGAGMGIAVILTAACFGAVGFHLRRAGRLRIGPVSLLVFGLAVHVLALSWAVLLPEGIRWDVVERVALPYLTVLPLATVLFGLLMLQVENRGAAERSLRASERRLATLIANLPGAAYRCKNTPDWPLDFISTPIRELTGYAPEDFVANRVIYGDLIHPEDREDVWTEVQAAIGEQRPFTLEYRLRDKQGQEKWVWEQGSLASGIGNEIYLEGLVIDITERKQAEQALERSRRDLAKAQAITHVGNWEYRIGDGRTRWSDELYRIFGLEPQSEALTYDKLIARVHPDDRQRHDAYSEAMLGATPGTPMEVMGYRLVRPDGEERDVRSRWRWSLAQMASRLGPSARCRT